MNTIYSQEELGDFVGAIRGASDAITVKNPSFYIVSLNGGLPLFDILSIINPNIDPNRAIYFPGSSKIKDSAEVLTNCFENLFLEKKDQTNEPRTIVSLDEVVSGDSIERLINSYNSASRRVARANLGGSQKQRPYVEKEAQSLREQFPLGVYGIKEQRENVTKMSLEYLNKVKKGEVLEFPTKRIITMDNEREFNLVKFDYPDSSGFRGQGYWPRVKEIVTTDAYLDLLRDVARLIGKDPERIEVVRTAKIYSDCEKYSKKPRYNP